jgi:hypothetical protein
MVDERDDLLSPGIQPQPGGVALALNRVQQLGIPKIKNTSQGYNKRGYYPDNTRRLQAMPLAQTAAKLAAEGNVDLAKTYYDAALSLKPVPRSSYEDLLLKERDFSLATDNFFQQLEQLRAQLQQPTR